MGDVVLLGVMWKARLFVAGLFTFRKTNNNPPDEMEAIRLHAIFIQGLHGCGTIHGYKQIIIAILFQPVMPALRLQQAQLPVLNRSIN